MENLDFKKTLHFDEFPDISTEEWESVIEKDLKGKDYKEVLRWNSGEGVEPLPFYRMEHLADLDHKQDSVLRSGEWKIIEVVESDDVTSANKEALQALENGATGLYFNPAENYLQTKKDIETLLNDIQIELISVRFGGLISSPEVAGWLKELCSTRGITQDQLSVCFNVDPLSDAPFSGKLPAKSDILKLNDNFDDAFKYCAVDNSVFANAGATVVQQIAFSLAVGNEYLGINSNLSHNMHFNFAAGPNYFLEIAKFRAFKLAWGRVLEEYDISNKPPIYAESSFWNKSHTDAHNNMLRTTTEAMAAAIGGCDGLAVHRYDKHFAEDSRFASRIARNIQLILQEEAHLDKVADPGAGSYYIEVLTESIAKKSWSLFQEIEAKGGFYECLKSGFIQRLISESQQKKIEAYKEKQKVLVGMNKYQPEKEDSNPKFQSPKFNLSGFDSDQTTDIQKISLLNIEAELQKGEK